jgi:hypothetical protein
LFFINSLYLFAFISIVYHVILLKNVMMFIIDNNVLDKYIMSNSKFKCKWSDEWLKALDGNGEVIGQWCSEASVGKARCRFCNKEFFVKSGKTNLLSHATSEQHKRLSNARKGCSDLTKLFTPTSTTCTHHFDLAKVSEIRIAARVVLKNQSFESYGDFVEDLKCLVPDSKIPDRMSLGPDKIAYTIVDALFPYVQGEILSDIKMSDFYSIHIDEANKLKSFVGIVVRYLNAETMEPKSVCIDIPSVDACDAETLCEAVRKSLIDDLRLDPKKCLSIMSDNCNVMRGTS